MKLNTDAIKGFAKLVCFKLKEVRPEIALGVGIASVAAGTVWACVKTKEVPEVVEDLKTDVATEKEYEKKENEGKIDILERGKLYAAYAFKFAKIYGLPFALWACGVGCIVGSHGEMRHRNAKLLADSVALKKLFDEYRERVRNAVGEEIEKKLYFGADTEKISVKEIDEETGEEKVVKKKVSVFNHSPGSMYARNFTSATSYEFEMRSGPVPGYFLETRIKNLNTKLRLVPFLTLNDIYDELGFKPGYGRCEEGMTVGWVWNPKIDRGDREIIVEYLDGYELKDGVYEPCLRLDFNCYPLEGLI